MMTRLTAADGHSLDCWIEPPKGPRRGGLVIVQEIFGVTEQLKTVAAHYASAGWEVAVPALFDRVERGAVVDFDDIDRARALMQGTDVETAMADIGAAVEVLAASGGKVAVLGFCWGGGLALRAAQRLDIAAAVSFYGTRLGEYLDLPLKAPVQGHFGAEDNHVPPALLDEVQAKLGPDFTFYSYPGAGHAFANEERPQVYVAEATEMAHTRAAAFLAQHMA